MYTVLAKAVRLITNFDCHFCNQQTRFSEHQLLPYMLSKHVFKFIFLYETSSCVCMLIVLFQYLKQELILMLYSV